jgi:surfactin synthase thioesterase subunit
LELAMPSLRADFRAFEAYVPAERPPVNVPFTVLRGLADPRITDADALAWRAATAQPVEVHAVDAGHFFVDTHAAWTMARVRDAIVAASG